jgi:hypothetical protein
VPDSAAHLRGSGATSSAARSRVVAALGSHGRGHRFDTCRAHHPVSIRTFACSSRALPSGSLVVVPKFGGMDTSAEDVRCLRGRMLDRRRSAPILVARSGTTSTLCLSKVPTTSDDGVDPEDGHQEDHADDDREDYPKSQPIDSSHGVSWAPSSGRDRALRPPVPSRDTTRDTSMSLFHSRRWWTRHASRREGRMRPAPGRHAVTGACSAALSSATRRRAALWRPRDPRVGRSCFLDQ